MDKAESKAKNIVVPTPWGWSDYGWDLLPGVQWLNTPGHGGLRISREYADQHFSAECLKALWGTGSQHKFLFFEEDCDWSLAVFESPEIGNAMLENGLSNGDVHGSALHTLVYWHPDYCMLRDVHIPDDAIEMHIRYIQHESEYLTFIDNLQRHGYTVPTDVQPMYKDQW